MNFKDLFIGAILALVITLIVDFIVNKALLFKL